MITEKNSHSNQIIVIDIISRFRFFFGGGEIIMYFILFDI